MFAGAGHPWTTAAGGHWNCWPLHGSPLPYSGNQRHFTTGPPGGRVLVGWMRGCWGLGHSGQGEMVGPVVFGPRRGIGLGRSTCKVNGCIDFWAILGCFWGVWGMFVWVF